MLTARVVSVVDDACFGVTCGGAHGQPSIVEYNLRVLHEVGHGCV